MWEVRQERHSLNILWNRIQFYRGIPMIWHVYWSWSTPWLVWWQVYRKDHTQFCPTTMKSRQSLAFIWDSWSRFSDIQNYHWSQEIRSEGFDYESPCCLRTTSNLAWNSSTDRFWMYHFLHQWRNRQEIQPGKEDPWTCCPCTKCWWNLEHCQIHYPCCHCLSRVQS